MAGNVTSCFAGSTSRHDVLYIHVITSRNNRRCWRYHDCGTRAPTLLPRIKRAFCFCLRYLRTPIRSTAFCCYPFDLSLSLSLISLVLRPLAVFCWGHCCVFVYCAVGTRGQPKVGKPRRSKPDATSLRGCYRSPWVSLMRSP